MWGHDVLELYEVTQMCPLTFERTANTSFQLKVAESLKCGQYSL